MDAKKKTLAGPEALALARAAEQIYVAKGKKIIHVDLKKEKPDDATLLRLMLGPTGNLRAPTVRRGKTLIVGFDAAIYADLLV